MESSTCKATVICGPTASGKTSVGIELAERVGGEIVSMDSRQIYRGLDVGTAKATAEEQARVRHHLIDVADPGDRFTVADYVDRAKAAIREITARGAKPVVVGGTPFYLSALLGDFEFCEVDADPEYRDRLRDEAAVSGSAALHERLLKVDPASAGKIHPNDLFRIVRALEIYHVTGAAPSGMRKKSVADPGRSPGADIEFSVYCLYTPRKKLYDRINKRVLFMYNSGLIEETRAVAERGAREREFLTKTIGYAQALAHIEGSATLESAIEETAKDTRRYAKRQLTWLRALEGVVWLNADRGGGVDPAELIRGRNY